jgi:hypothetical protein
MHRGCISGGKERNKMDISQTWTAVQKFFSQFQNVSLVHGGISSDDMNELHALILQNHYKTNHNTQNIKICELGCWTGMSTVLFGKIAQECHGSVKAIDWFKGAETDNLETCAKMFNIKLICQNNLKENKVDDVVEVIDARTDEAITRYPDEYFDVVFIDADHRYTAVKKDIQQWLMKVKKGGLLCGHDCDIILTNGLQSIYDKWGDRNWVGFHLGVAKAVSEEIPQAKKTETGVVWYYVRPTST